MGFGLLVAKAAEVAGGAMAGIGASITIEGIVVENGFRYCSTKFGKACVMCAAWAVGGAAGTKVSELFVEQVDEVVEGFTKIKNVIANGGTDVEGA